MSEAADALYTAACEAVRKQRAGEFDEVMTQVGFDRCAVVRVGPDELIIADPHSTIPGAIVVAYSRGAGADWRNERWIVGAGQNGPTPEQVANCSLRVAA